MVRSQQSNKVGKSPRITGLEQCDGLAEDRTAMAVLNDNEDPTSPVLNPVVKGRISTFYE